MCIRDSEQTTSAAGYDLVKAHDFNVALSARTPYVVDWNGTLVGNLATYTTSPDFVTPTAAGQAQLASMIQSEVDQCFASTGTSA